MVIANIKWMGTLKVLRKAVGTHCGSPKMLTMIISIAKTKQNKRTTKFSPFWELNSEGVGLGNCQESYEKPTLLSFSEEKSSSRITDTTGARSDLGESNRKGWLLPEFVHCTWWTQVAKDTDAENEVLPSQGKVSKRVKTKRKVSYTGLQLQLVEKAPRIKPVQH